MSESRTYLVVGGVLALAVIGVRLVQASLGSISTLQAGTELAIVISIGIVGAAAWMLAERASGIALVILGLAVTAWAADVVVPVWRLGHPPAPLFDGKLGGATREAASNPAVRAGRYEVRVTPQTGKEGPFTVIAGSAGQRRLLDGTPNAPPEAAELHVVSAGRIDLFLERGEGVKVKIVAAPLPWGPVTWGGFAVGVLACVADILLARGRERGLFAAASLGTIIFAIALDPVSNPTGETALAVAALGIVGGGILGGIVGFIGGRVTSRREHAEQA